PIVSDMAQASGVIDDHGTNWGGFRSVAYGYSEAMYNHFGRGFTGFHKIYTETETYNSSRRLITTTTFNQKFPLTGKVDSVVTTTALINGPVKTVRYEQDTYGCDRNNRTAPCPTGDALPPRTAQSVYRPFLDKQTVQNFDPATG